MLRYTVCRSYVSQSAAEFAIRLAPKTGARSTFNFTADGLTTPTSFSIAVPTNNTPYASGVTPYTVNRPAEVVITETNTDYVLTRAECTKPPLPNLTAPQTTVTASGNSLSIKAFSFGGMTVCTLYNTPKTRQPKFTVSKEFTGFVNPLDSAAITVTEAEGASASTTVSNASGSRTGQTSLTGNRVVFTTTTTDTLTTATGLPAGVTMSESLSSANPGNYTSAYSCTNAATGTGTTLPASASGTSLTIASPNFGDDITCTFVNELTVAPPSTTVNVTKDGLRVVTVGTAVTYSITAQNTTATAVDVALTDQLSPVLPAAQVTSSDGGTYDAATGLVTWPRVSVPANGSVTRTVTVDVPDPVEDAVSGDTYSGPSQVSNTANLTTYGVGDSNPLPNNGASSAGVTTNYLFAQVRKTVQNVTPERESAAGTSVQAEPGDTLQYCLNYTNQSAVPLTLTLTDELAPFQTLVPGSFTGGTNTGTGNQVQVKLPDVAAGDSGSVCFRVTLDPL